MLYCTTQAHVLCCFFFFLVCWAFRATVAFDPNSGHKCMQTLPKNLFFIISKFNIIVFQLSFLLLMSGWTVHNDKTNVLYHIMIISLTLSSGCCCCLFGFNAQLNAQHYCHPSPQSKCEKCDWVHLNVIHILVILGPMWPICSQPCLAHPLFLLLHFHEARKSVKLWGFKNVMLVLQPDNEIRSPAL